MSSSAEMMLADRENLQVNYLVREEDGHYKVRDIAITRSPTFSRR